MSEAYKGATVNAGGTKIAAAKGMGSGPLDTTKAELDPTTLVFHGNQSMTIKQAKAHGFLRRNAAGTLEELNPAGTPTRVNS